MILAPVEYPISVAFIGKKEIKEKTFTGAKNEQNHRH
jgi:hypothetical protein